MVILDHRLPEIDETERLRNPFYSPLVTEILDNPTLYRELFSESILVGEALSVFQRRNIVVTGPQGTGKTMILNLIRYRTVAEWLERGDLPRPLSSVPPYFGVSINLTRADFHAFGRRSISQAMGLPEHETVYASAAAADYLNQFLFREFLRGLRLILSGASPLANWLGIQVHASLAGHVASDIASWDCWYGYYSNCATIPSLIERCDQRLQAYRRFLNVNDDHIDEVVWRTKTDIGEPLHRLGTLLAEAEWSTRRAPLYVVIDQYEVLPELNRTHGTDLQRVVNTFIKLRDPVVFYKVGARTHNWGRELRVWGAESRIEFERDYGVVDLNELLSREETNRGWLFERFALDVTSKRMRQILGDGAPDTTEHQVRAMFPSISPEEESRRYLHPRGRDRRRELLPGLSESVRDRILTVGGPDASPLDIRLAGAHALQLVRRGMSEDDVLLDVSRETWRSARSWKAERTELALLQVASILNQRKLYCGWSQLVLLAGRNISAFLMICREVWDAAVRLGIVDVAHGSIPDVAQSLGVARASEAWRERDRDEHTGDEHTGGRWRYEVLGRIGPALGQALISDYAMSNPGWSGFSVSETEMNAQTAQARELVEFLESGAGWAMFEESPHTSRFGRGTARRKWYLHPLLSPIFRLPIRRIKEPRSLPLATVHAWIFNGAASPFERHGGERRNRTRDRSYLQLRLGGPR
jgi:hypothetical protein